MSNADVLSCEDARNSGNWVDFQEKRGYMSVSMRKLVEAETWALGI